MKHLLLSLRLAATIAVLGAASGCSSKAGPLLSVGEKEFSVTPSATHVAAGSVKIAVRNKGVGEHELVVFRSTMDESKLPLTVAGDRVDEEAAGITHLDPEAEGVKPGHTKHITIDLSRGRYVFVCNLARHYTQGMHAVVTVG